MHKEGQQPINTPSKPKHGILATANDWRISVDLGNQLVFPREITVTNMRPDIVICSMELCPTKQFFQEFQDFQEIFKNFKVFNFQFSQLSQDSLWNVENLESLETIESLENLESLDRLDRVWILENLEIFLKILEILKKMFRWTCMVLCHCWPTPLIPDHITDNGPKRSRGARDWRMAETIEGGTWLKNHQLTIQRSAFWKPWLRLCKGKCQNDQKTVFPLYSAFNYLKTQ